MPTSRPAAVVLQTSKNRTKRNNSKTPRLLEIQTMSPYYPVCPVSNAEWYPCVAKIDQKTPFGNADDITVRTRLADRF
jgi:hypothetical protein